MFQGLYKMYSQLFKSVACCAVSRSSTEGRGLWRSLLGREASSRHLSPHLTVVGASGRGAARVLAQFFSLAGSLVCICKVTVNSVRARRAEHGLVPPLWSASFPLHVYCSSDLIPSTGGDLVCLHAGTPRSVCPPSLVNNLLHQRSNHE